MLEAKRHGKSPQVIAELGPDRSFLGIFFFSRLRNKYREEVMQN